ncbi:ATP/ADP translocase [Deinococcus yavapaiensis KR-236]|uniref:ATP/ADP translocase n=1 Tax=Deinococcus yavapaiensis KR-236 TaxID=694435 RepID=A0A318S7G6_9DEIO|nr:ATP/ADP translocase [Deinococcus yavapaiensis KR-236]
MLNLRAGEWRPVLVLGLMLLCNAFAMQISYVSSVAGFLAETDVDNILLVWIIDFALIAVLTGAQSLVVDRFERRKLFVAVTLVFALAFVGVRCLFWIGAPGWLSYGALYMLAEQQWLFFPLVFWAFANGLFTTSQSTRIIPVVSSFAFAGRLLGLGFAALVPALLARSGAGLESLVLVNAAVYLGILLTFLTLGRDLQPTTALSKRAEGMRETLTEGWEFVREVPAFRYLTGAMVALAVTETIVEFHFFRITSEAFAAAGSYETFYSLYRLVNVLLAFSLQLLVTSRLLQRLTLKKAFYVAPIAYFLAVACMFALPGVLGGAFGMTLQKTTRDTVDDSARKSLQGVVPEERRGRVSMFMDSYVLSFGTIVASLLTFGIVVLGAHLPLVTGAVYLGVAAMSALLAWYLVRRMSLSYDQSMLNWRLKRRGRTSSVLDRLNL